LTGISLSEIEIFRNLAFFNKEDTELTRRLSSCKAIHRMLEILKLDGSEQQLHLMKELMNQRSIDSL